jgi:hypothetical protein
MLGLNQRAEFGVSDVQRHIRWNTRRGSVQAGLVSPFHKRRDHGTLCRVSDHADEERPCRWRALRSSMNDRHNHKVARKAKRLPGA